MVDEERLLRLLDGVRRDVARIRERAKQQRDPVGLDAVKYRFITAIEGAARAAHHIAVSEGWATPESNADAFRVLASNRVIGADVADRMSQAAGFRNVLVHQYAEVDDDLVIAAVDRLSDLDSFTTQVADWLRQTAG